MQELKTVTTETIKNIKAVVLDIDGVLTDGRISFIGDNEIKFFHVSDGHGIKLAKRTGLKVGALSGRGSEANRRRARELSFDFLYEDKKKKGEAFEVLLSENNLTAKECLYMGDDHVDIPVLRQVGIAITVADAPIEMNEFCDFRTEKPGGHGAVREALEWLLKERKEWKSLMSRYFVS